jgi:hypothetical protein
MLRIRKLKTKSGSTAIQVVQYTGHSSKIVKHIVSSRDDIERDLLINKTQEWIGKCAMQSNLFPEQKQNVLIVERSECVRKNLLQDLSSERAKNMNNPRRPSRG